MVTTIEYITTAVSTVFKNKNDLADAQTCLSSASIPAILSCLDEACSCSFSALANLKNDPPPQAVADSINSAITASGGTASSDAYIPVGTLGSFYSCVSLTDTSPVLIAEGLNTKTGMDREKQKCHIWAFSKLIVTTDYEPNSALHPDYGDPSVDEDGYQDVFGSFSSDGGCFSVSRPEASLEGWNSAVAADSCMICIYALDH